MTCQPASAGFRITCVVALLACTPAAHAQLYAREAPPGSAFIHVFNATPNAGVPVQIGDRVQPPLSPFTASSYIFLPPGEYIVRAGPYTQPFKLEGNHYYTVSGNANGLRLFDFNEPLTKLKATVALFNLTPDLTLTLKTAEGGATVFDSVAPASSAQRAINPLQLNLALFNGDKKIANVPQVALQRGQSFSLFVSGTQVSPVLVWHKD
jgi:alginate O-acetyltransferase complex protein AlgF